MLVHLASEAAPGRSVNEDGALHIGNLVGVFDGVTAAPDIPSGCIHGPAWYVERLISQLSQIAEEALKASLSDLLAEAIVRVRQDHEGRCDLGNPATPAATLCLVRADGNSLEYLILADCTLVVDQGENTVVLTDERFINAVSEIRRAALAAGGFKHPVGTPTSGKYALINQPHGYWIASSSPQAARQAVTGKLSGVRRAALLTDGLSCAVDQYNLMTWDGLLDLLAEAGPRALIRRVREAEDDDGMATEFPRYKRHDDATAALCLFEEP